jgi:hypothetical protein
MGRNTPTLTFNIEERAYGSLGSAGTDVMTSDLQASATGQDRTGSGLGNAAIAAQAHLVFVTDTSAASDDDDVDFITIFVTYSF